MKAHFFSILFCILFLPVGLLGNGTCRDQNKHIELISSVDTFIVPPTRGFITDLEMIFSEKEKARLDSLILDYNRKTGVQIAILSFDSSYTSIENFEKFTLTVLNTWGLGEKSKNNGILIAICPDYRTIRIENGYGIEAVLSDQETKNILTELIVPHFKKAEYFRGVYDGLLKIMSVLDDRL